MFVSSLYWRGLCDVYARLNRGLFVVSFFVNEDFMACLVYGSFQNFHFHSHLRKTDHHENVFGMVLEIFSI